MGYPDSVLADGEHVILHRHPHWKRMVVPVVLLLVLTAGGVGLLTLKRLPAGPP